MAVITPLPRSVRQRNTQRITQAQLLECLNLQQEARIADERYRRAMEEIFDGMGAGYIVDQGPLHVALERASVNGGFGLRVEVKR